MSSDFDYLGNRVPVREAFLDYVVNILKKGGVILLPTDSMYSLSCSVMEKKAINRLYKLKKVDKFKPMSLICSGISMASEYALISNRAFKLIKRLTPGPYTFILEATKVVPKVMLTRRRTVGIRIPDKKISLDIVEKLGCPLLSTSISSIVDKDILDPDELRKFFGNRVDCVVDGGKLFTDETTIIDLTGDEPEIIRKGLGEVDFL